MSIGDRMLDVTQTLYDAALDSCRVGSIGATKALAAHRDLSLAQFLQVTGAGLKRHTYQNKTMPR